MASVVIKNLRKAYDETEVMKDINLEIADGEFVVFVGPSGCGKSTLLRMIAGLEEITGGDLLIGDQRMNDVHPSKRGIAMVFQSYALYPHMNLYDNMAFGLRLAGQSKDQIDVAVKKAANILHIEHLLDRKPKHLSGGQRQRVAIGRAITREPKAFLFDEPLSNLDAALRVKMRLEFARLHDDLKTTMIYVTHDQVEAMTLADKIVVLSAGRVEQFGSPHELYHHPANRFVAGFIGSPTMNFLEGEVSATDASGVTVKVRDGGVQRVAVEAGKLRVGDAVTVGIRPEYLQPGGDNPAVVCKVSAVESLGDSAYVYADAACSEEGLIVRIPPLQKVDRSAPMRLSADPEHCHLFAKDGKARPRLANKAMAA